MGRAEQWALDMAAAERSMERIYARWDDLRDPDDDATINEWERFIEDGSAGVNVSASHRAFLGERYGPIERAEWDGA